MYNTNVLECPPPLAYHQRSPSPFSRRSSQPTTIPGLPQRPSLTSSPSSEILPQLKPPPQAAEKVELEVLPSPTEMNVAIDALAIPVVQTTYRFAPIKGVVPFRPFRCCFSIHCHSSILKNGVVTSGSWTA
jgi:hypothetical protein